MSTSTTIPKHGWKLGEIEKAGLGSIRHLYDEIAAGRLRAVKCGKRTIVLDPDLETWKGNFKPAKIAPRMRKTKDAA